ncbi:pyridoxal phosphate-dependent transferase [Aspergillus pseudonomiae]|uniref:Pyridoxal phosphate-dependent transferase n=1 Tax=Aspergillus pseudonomiae TaxID=1506151 RepID=A0A5N7D3I9_9EURO|nr:pyridoxal phosphate-dependent transferase [Aspergillus pseudonomiae]KAE8400975.1 pyridoxal phosphate-dependent transferase [Aspergillus pseudonomiae]
MTVIQKSTSNGHRSVEPPLDHDFHNAWGTIYSNNAFVSDNRARQMWEEYTVNPGRVEQQYHVLLNEYTDRFQSFFNGFWPITFHAHVSDALIPTTVASLILNTASTCPLVVEDPALSPLLKDDPEPEKVQEFVRNLLGWNDVHIKTPKLAIVDGIYGCAYGPLAHSSDEWEYRIIGSGPESFYVRRSDFVTEETLLNKLIEAKKEGCVAVICDLVNASDGSVLPPEYFRLLRKCCDKVCICLLVDEAMTAIRCGAPLVHQRPEYCEDGGIQPDMIAFGKGMGISGIAINFNGLMMRHLAFHNEALIRQSIRFWRSMVTRPIATTVLIEALGTLNVAAAENWPARSEQIGKAFRKFVIRHAKNDLPPGEEIVRGLGAFIAVPRDINKKFNVMAAFRRRSAWARWIPKLNMAAAMLPPLLSQAGALITVKRWLDEDIIPSILNHDVVTFLWAEDYIRHPIEFQHFLMEARTAIESIKDVDSRPCMVNPIELVQWNMDKKYLLEMYATGFDIPKMGMIEAKQFDSVSALHRRLIEFQSSGPVVLKPAISASSNNTTLICDVSTLSKEDTRHLQSCIDGRLGSSIVLQEFEPSISAGEYSFIFVGESLSHVVLKSPRSGEFRCQPSFGGELGRIPMEEIQETTLSVVQSIFDTLKDRFGIATTGKLGYMRVDGLVTKDRPFILMEIEAIEPCLYFEMEGLDQMLSLLLSN